MIDSQNCVTMVAPAKVNLFLHITGRQPDGYHLLQSLFAFTETGDEITVAHSDRKGVSMNLGGAYASRLHALGAGGEKNLVVKAVHKMAKVFAKEPNLSIKLVKNLPVEAGIGGGSSDAAAVLLALRDLWQLDVALPDLIPLAQQLGADVPACLYQSAVWVEGIGEQLEPFKVPWQAYIVLVNPGVSVPTPEIFAEYKAQDTVFDMPVFDKAALCASPARLQGHSQNSLQRAAASRAPVIAEVLELLSVQPGAHTVRMSGSGATCFALFEDKEAAALCLSAIQNLQPGWWAMADRLV